MAAQETDGDGEPAGRGDRIPQSDAERCPAVVSRDARVTRRLHAGRPFGALGAGVTAASAGYRIRLEHESSDVAC